MKKGAISEDGRIICPKCGCSDLVSSKKGFGVAKAGVGALIAGPIGLLAGGIGQNKIKMICPNCKHSWKV